ncbi:MAG TPA: DUF1569 domain-containing protein [Ignavibacteriales bacterium]|nr:DUF1569 domain-containing protein [Ignavibacteriales bacterium]HEX3073580.1 DUF1569 domain-containing protein [Ignavibacteriales bacterium]
MTTEMKEEFVKRIFAVTADDQKQFGQMNVNQMICHCADQFRIMFGEMNGIRRQQIDLNRLKEMNMRGEPVPTVDGLDQAAGQGTKPTELELDKRILLDYINKFFESEDDYNFSYHPYFGDLNKSQWDRLAVHHLDHHLKQFGR